MEAPTSPELRVANRPRTPPACSVPSPASGPRGQTLALLLTLVGTPMIYSLFDDIVEARIFSRAGNAVARLFGRGKPEPVTAS